jgi:hypothetical protein
LSLTDVSAADDPLLVAVIDEGMVITNTSPMPEAPVDGEIRDNLSAPATLPAVYCVPITVAPGTSGVTCISHGTAAGMNPLSVAAKVRSTDDSASTMTPSFLRLKFLAPPPGTASVTNSI